MGHAAAARPRYEAEGTPIVASSDDDGYRIAMLICAGVGGVVYLVGKSDSAAEPAAIEPPGPA